MSAESSGSGCLGLILSGSSGFRFYGTDFLI